MSARTTSRFGAFMLAAVGALSVLLCPNPAAADKVHLKDGRVLEGRISREGQGFIFLVIRVGSIEQQQLINSEDISRIERDEPVKDDAPKSADAAAPAKAEESSIPQTASDTRKKYDATTKSLTGATRVAILNFGPPSNWLGKFEDMVGVQVSVKAFKDAVPLLEKANVDVVVIRINSGGGYTLEMIKFHNLFEQEYKPRFRTVAWIESAISAAAMSPWVLEEFYFFPNGSMGACTEFSGALNASKGLQLELRLHSMEEASRLGKKDPAIMRAMQIMEPLSVDVSPSGDVVWRQDEQGQFVLNRKEEVYTINAQDALRFKFARGIAATREELVRAMGLQEVEWVAQDATDLVDKSIRDNDNVANHAREVYIKYMNAIQAAQSAQDDDKRGAQLGIAKRLLAELRRMVKLNPNFEFHIGIPDEWFEEQEELIRKLSKKK